MSNDFRVIDGGAGKRVGLIGLGIMGSAIAKNLMKAGNIIVGFDTDATRVREMKAMGVEMLDSATFVAASADLVLTSLPSADALDITVAAIVKGVSGKRSGFVVAELSTLPLDRKMKCRDVLTAAGITMLDCPLSGTGAQAAAGDVAIYASGDVDAVDRCKGVFSGFAKVTHYLGVFGNGTKMKFVANLLVAIHNVAAGEAIALATKAGLDSSTLCNVLASGAGGSRMFEMRAPMMVKETYEPATMKMDVWQKDMELIAEFAKSLGAATPLFTATAPLYDKAIAQGRGQEDTAAVHAVLKDMKP